VLCPSCRRQVARGAGYCTSCGRSFGAESTTFDLVLADGSRVLITDELTLGRAPENTIVLDDRSVSRAHARVYMGNAGPEVEDVGSSHGTWLDGRQVQGKAALHDGAVLRLGDIELKVEGRHEDDVEAAGRTIMMRAGASLLVPAVGPPVPTGATAMVGMRPKVRSGWALKRLAASEGEKRWILRDLRAGKFTRLSDDDAALFELLDGQHELPDLIAEAETRAGAAGPGKLARLLADLGERGLLEGIEGTAPVASDVPAPKTRLQKIFGPREKSVADAGDFFANAYRRGGWLLFTRPALALTAVLGVGGIGAFVYLIVGRYGTPFVVAKKLGIGGAVFMAGRFFLVGLHELAHGLTMASYGRRVGKAGLKFFAILPYGFVDVSESWFEPRRRRIAIAAAGPVSDLALAGTFAIVCALLSHGVLRDIFFNLAFGAYIGGFFNLNPFLDRDGYHIMVDILREPGLRQRSRAQLGRWLARKPAEEGDSPVLLRFATAGLVWSFVAAIFAIFMSTRYYPVITRLAPKGVVLTVFGLLYVVLFIPVLWTVGRPLWEQRAQEARSKAEVDGARA
jgi:putative peptide zinc metalloprotease protein